MKRKASAIFALIAVTVVVVIACAFVHELGHGVVVIASGGRITRLSIASAHIWYEGVNTSPLAMSLIHIGGTLLPVLLLLASLIFYNRSAKNLIYQLAYGFFFITITASVLPLLFFPILSIFTQIPPADDVTKFLESSHLQPLWVACIGFIIIAFLIFFAYVKKLPQGFICCFKSVINTQSSAIIFHKKTLAGLLAVFVLLISTVALLELPWLSSKAIISLSVSGPVTSVDHTRNFTFMVEESGVYKLDIKLTASGYLTDIRILDDTQNVVYQNIAEGISDNSSLSLNAGEHTIYVEHLYDWEMFESYCKTMDYTFNGDSKVWADLKSCYEHVRQEPSLSLVIK